jgi:uncharacterized protein (DUF1800 family)
VISESDARHLLRRTEFVARPERVAALTGLTLEQAVDDVLDVGRNGPPSMPAAFTDPEPVDRWAQYAQAYQWWMDRMVHTPRPFAEKMTLFWHGHFTSSWSDGVPTDLMTRQNHLYRSLALGNLRELTQRMAVEPAMVLYLSNASNVAGAPNENFARELLELFTLGVGNYTQADVVAAARAWTGHGYDDATHSYRFRPGLHDHGPKTFMGDTRHWDGPQIIDALFTRPDTAPKVARFIARQLWLHLAGPEPSTTVLDALVATFLANGFELRPLVRALLLRPEFYATEVRQGLVRPPTDWAVALLHHAGLHAVDLWLETRAASTGQLLFSPPNVAGWKGNSAWVTTSALSGRAEIAKTVAWWNLRATHGFDHLAAMDVDAAIDDVARRFDVYPLSATTRAAIVAAQQAERASGDDPWWGPTNLILAVLLSPEFQLA